MGTQTKWGPRTYGNRTNNTWQEKVCDSDGSNCRTETYYTTVQDPGDGGPFGLSGDLAGKTTIYKRNDSVWGWLTGQSGDIIVGEIPAYGPNKGKLIRPPNVAPGGPLDKTITHFSEPDNLKRVKNQAILTTKKGMLADKDVYGNDIEPITDDPEVADKLARKLLNTGSALKDEEKEEEEEEEADDKPGKEDTKSITDDNKDKAGTNKDFGKDLRYPITMSDTQDTLKIDMVEYTAKGFRSKGGNWGGSDRSKAGEGDRKIIGTVVLPIPGGIKDADKVNWSDNSMDALLMAAGDLAGSAIEGGPDKAKKSIFASMDALDKSGGGKFKEIVKGGFTAAAIGKDFKSIMARQTGQIMNPNMELLFTGPALRPFSFDFLLAPRSKKESEMVMKIIRFFKQGMAPIRSEANLFLKSPHTFQLTYKHGNDNHLYLNSFKECALKSCNVNYTPEQSYSTYTDGVMTAYQMSLQFMELEPVYNDDYGTENAANLNFAAGATPATEGTDTSDKPDTTGPTKDVQAFMDDSGYDRKTAETISGGGFVETLIE